MAMGGAGGEQGRSPRMSPCFSTSGSIQKNAPGTNSTGGVHKPTAG